MSTEFEASGLPLTQAGAVQDIKAKDIRRGDVVLASPREWALFLDIDGTLLGVASTPDAVRVPRAVVTLLDNLVREFEGAVAFLTGRRVAEADRLFAPLRLVASGVHGTELRRERDGPIERLAPHVSSSIVQALNEVGAIAPGIMIEQKGSGVAVHYRKAPAARPAIEAEVQRVLQETNCGLVIRQGRKVLELVPKTFSKATAMRELLALEPFKGRRPVMVGDDAGDESALVAADVLGGIGLKVAGEHFRRAEADFSGVESVRRWLSTLLHRFGTAAVCNP
jgi:trehalose 6-phosphate phosphatase